MRSRLPPFALSIALGFVVLAEGRALAAEPAPPDTPHSERHWYGWQSAMVDVAAVGLTLPLALRDDTNELLLFAFVGPPTYAVGAPIVHFAHDNVPQGLASLGLRVGAPPVLGAVASLGCEPGRRDKCFIGTALASMLVAMVLDDALLAYETVPSPRPNARSLHFQPTLALDRHGATVGIGLSL